MHRCASSNAVEAGTPASHRLGEGSWRESMSKKGKMFPGVTRQVVISDDTHQLLCEAAQHENKYIGELADEIIRCELRQRSLRAQESERVEAYGYNPHMTAVS